jgi:hypothetical protein
MSPITPDSFAEYSPNLQKHSSESDKFGENAVVLPEKLTTDLKDLAINQADTGYSEGVIGPNDHAAREKYQNNSYLYHRVPDKMHGQILYPLNELKQVNEELYKLYAEGYKDRHKLMATHVPVLDCLWNDVLFLSPVHPQKLYDLAKAIGLDNKWRFKRFYAFKPGKELDLENSVVFYRIGKEMDAMVYRPGREVKISELNKVPALTKAYYEIVAKKHEDLFPYQYVPQVMYKGTIDISNAEVIELS